MKDYYAILNVDPDASRSEIHAAYRRASFLWHPDRAKPSEREAAHARFLELSEAYAALRDPVDRAHFDRLRQPQRPRRATPPPARKTPPPRPAWTAPRSEEPPVRESDGVPGPPPQSVETWAAWRRQVRALAQALADADPRWRRWFRALRWLMVGILLVLLVATLLWGLGGAFPEGAPPGPILVVAWAGYSVLFAWVSSARERRVESYQPLADEVLRRARSGSNR